MEREYSGDNVKLYDRGGYIESDIRTFGDAGVEYDAGVASAILSAYGPELSPPSPQ